MSWPDLSIAGGSDALALDLQVDIGANHQYLLRASITHKELM